MNFTGPSGFTTEASATTPAAPINADPIYVNFNRSWGSNLPAPWFNSFSATPTQGLVLGSLIDDQGVNTGIDLTLETNWFRITDKVWQLIGFAAANVSRTAYWFNSDQESLKLSNLNPLLFMN